MKKATMFNDNLMPKSLTIKVMPIKPIIFNGKLKAAIHLFSIETLRQPFDLIPSYIYW